MLTKTKTNVDNSRTYWLFWSDKLSFSSCNAGKTRIKASYYSFTFSFGAAKCYTEDNYMSLYYDANFFGRMIE